VRALESKQEGKQKKMRKKRTGDVKKTPWRKDNAKKEPGPRGDGKTKGKNSGERGTECLGQIGDKEEGWVVWGTLCIKTILRPQSQGGAKKSALRCGSMAKGELLREKQIRKERGGGFRGAATKKEGEKTSKEKKKNTVFEEGGAWGTPWGGWDGEKGGGKKSNEKRSVVQERQSRTVPSL